MKNVICKPTVKTSGTQASTTAMEEKVKGDTVKVTVIKASDLVRKHMMAKPDPFVRFGVLQKGGNPSSLKDETKTPVIKDDFNPSWGMFDHTFQVPRIFFAERIPQILRF